MDTLTARAETLRERARKLKSDTMIERMSAAPELLDDLADYLVEIAQAVERLKHA